MTTTRLAPSPTGALHLGNVRTLALTWLAARAEGARLILRIEDIDSPRKKPGAVESLIDELRWLGLDWDGEPVIQSQYADRHREALSTLIGLRRVYACTCTRRDLETARSAPHAEDEVQYPGTCLGRYPDPMAAFEAVGRPVALRFRSDETPFGFLDRIHGSITRSVQEVGGDFVLARYSPITGAEVGYQLAVVVDDAAGGVDLVIRGDDLLPSTPRQRALQSALGLAEPTYAHLPLVIGPDGRRLAKRHGDTRLRAYREAGISKQAILEWVARSAGLSEGAFAPSQWSGFSWRDLPRSRVVVPQHDVREGPMLQQSGLCGP